MSARGGGGGGGEGAANDRGGRWSYASGAFSVDEQLRPYGGRDGTTAERLVIGGARRAEVQDVSGNFE